MKRFVSIVMVVVMLLSVFNFNSEQKVLATVATTSDITVDATPSPNSNKPMFRDITSNHSWASNAIQYFYNAGIVNGTGNGNFSPDESITREAFAKILSTLFKLPVYTGHAQSYSDVDNTMWSYKYIEAVQQYLTGYYLSGQKPFFNPTGMATREDIAVALVKAAGYDKSALQDPNILEQKFKDADMVSPKLKKLVALAVEKELIIGNNGNLRPQDTISRAETVVLLFRSIKSISNYEEPNVTTSPTSLPSVSILPTSAPTAEVTAKTEQNIYSEKVLNFVDPTIQSGSNTIVGGKIRVASSSTKEYEELSATIYTDQSGYVNEYRIQSTGIYFDENADEIQGTFDIIKNHELVAHGLPAHIVGLLQPLGASLEFYSEDKGWQFTATIEKRNTYNPPTATATPTPVPDFYAVNHEIKSNKLFDFRIDKIKPRYYFDNLKDGNLSLSWSEKNKSATLNVIFHIVEDGVINEYIIELHQPSNITRTEISGNFNVRKNGKLIVENVEGYIGNYNQGEGGQVTICIGDDKYSILSIISSRKDD